VQGRKRLILGEDQLLSAHRFPNITRLDVRPALWRYSLSPAQVVVPLLHLSTQHLPHLRHLELQLQPTHYSLDPSCTFFSLQHIGILSDALARLTCLKVGGPSRAAQQQGEARGGHCRCPASRHTRQPDMLLLAD
jgi:hypothetical protein